MKLIINFNFKNFCKIAYQSSSISTQHFMCKVPVDFESITFLGIGLAMLLNYNNRE
jgi:hypothetical protein